MVAKFCFARDQQPLSLQLPKNSVEGVNVE